MDLCGNETAMCSHTWEPHNARLFGGEFGEIDGTPELLAWLRRLGNVADFMFRSST